jgi:hypothetical protein
MKIRLSLYCFASLVFLPCAPAAVVLQDSYTSGATLGTPTALSGGVFGYEIDLATAGFTAAGTGKMVLSYSSWDNVSIDMTVASVTYNGAALTAAVQDIDNSDRIVAGIFYLDNVASDGVLRIEIAGNPGVNAADAAFGVYALDGLTAGVQDTGTVRTAAELTTTLPVMISTSEGFFIQEAARNNQDFTGGGGFTEMYDIVAGSYRGLQQYRLTDTPGTYVAPIGNTGENFRRVVAAGFEAVPEPSSLALAALGGLLLVTRRRRD